MKQEVNAVSKVSDTPTVVVLTGLDRTLRLSITRSIPRQNLQQMVSRLDLKDYSSTKIIVQIIKQGDSNSDGKTPTAFTNATFVLAAVASPDTEPRHF